MAEILLHSPQIYLFGNCFSFVGDSTILIFWIFTVRNVFTSVCHSVHREVSAWHQPHPLGRHPPSRQTPPWADTLLDRRLLQRTVRILLECILVFSVLKATTRKYQETKSNSFTFSYGIKNATAGQKQLLSNWMHLII